MLLCCTLFGTLDSLLSELGAGKVLPMLFLALVLFLRSAVFMLNPELMIAPAVIVVLIAALLLRLIGENSTADMIKLAIHTLLLSLCEAAASSALEPDAAMLVYAFFAALLSSRLKSAPEAILACAAAPVLAECVRFAARAAVLKYGYFELAGAALDAQLMGILAFALLCYVRDLNEKPFSQTKGSV